MAAAAVDANALAAIGNGRAQPTTSARDCAKISRSMHATPVPKDRSYARMTRTLGTSAPYVFHLIMALLTALVPAAAAAAAARTRALIRVVAAAAAVAVAVAAAVDAATDGGAGAGRGGNRWNANQGNGWW